MPPTLQQRLDNSDVGHVIYLSHGIYDQDLNIKHSLKIIGLNATISGDIHCDQVTIFENCIFEAGIVISGKVTFVNCVFTGTVKINKSFGVTLKNCLCSFINCQFIYHVSNVSIFVGLVAVKDSNVHMSGSIIEITHDHVAKIETIICKSSATNIFNANCTSITIIGKESTRVRIYKGVGKINSVLNTTTLNCDGLGLVDIASGDKPVYFNGLNVVAIDGSKWSVDKYKNIFLTGFLSNFINGSKLKNFTCYEAGNSEN